MLQKLNNIFPIIFTVILTIITVVPLFHPGFFPMHDNTQVQRVYEMSKSLSDGMFPVRWVADLGYGFGYPIFNFYAPFAYYVGAFFQLLGFNALLATKIMIGFAYLLSGVTMYFFAKQLFGILGGVVSSIFYVYAPYHALDLYVRGDVAELYAYAFLPLFFYGLFLIYTTVRKKGLIYGSIGFSGIILSHNLSAMMMAPFGVIFAILVVLLSAKKQRIMQAKMVLLILLIGVGLAAFYWIPAITEMKYTNVQSVISGGSNFADHFVCPFQLWNSPWGFGGSAPGCVDGLSYRIGKVNILVALFAVVLLFINWFWNRKQKNKEVNFFILFFFLGALISTFFTLSISQLFWEILKPMAYFQFPWRFLFPISFFSSLLAGSILFLISNIGLPKNLNSHAIRLIVAAVFIAGTIFVNIKLFAPQYFSIVTSSNFTNSSYLRYTTSKISDEYMPKQFIKPKNGYETLQKKLIINSKTVKIYYQQEKTQTLVYRYFSPVSTTGIVNIAYFPAWKIYIDSFPILFTNTNKGLLFNIPKGNHTITIQFESTTVEMIGNIISLASIVSLLIVIIVKQRKTL